LSELGFFFCSSSSIAAALDRSAYNLSILSVLLGALSNVKDWKTLLPVGAVLKLCFAFEDYIENGRVAVNVGWWVCGAQSYIRLQVESSPVKKLIASGEQPS
jgi:hypothetical protein